MDGKQEDSESANQTVGLNGDQQCAKQLQESFASISQVEEAYGLPYKSSKKPTGKAAKSPFESFSKDLYEESSFYNCFRTSSERLGAWIFAICHLIYQGQFAEEHNVDWYDNFSKSENKYKDIEITVNSITRQEK